MKEVQNDMKEVRNDINGLIERYLNGETSVEDEDRLNEYFRQPGIPDEMLPYKQMFEMASEPNDAPDDDALRSFAMNNGVGCRRNGADKKRHFSKTLSLSFKISSAAAAAILIFMAGYHVNNGEAQQPTDIRERIVKVTNTVHDTVRERIPVVINKTVDRKVYVIATQGRRAEDVEMTSGGRYDVASNDIQHSSRTADRTIFPGNAIDMNMEFSEGAKAQAEFENQEMNNFIKTLGDEVYH